MVQWAAHKHAPYYLAGVSFVEASVFPIPPDIMLAPMVLAKPYQWLRLSCLTAFFSIAGGILGYFIGMFAFESIGTGIIDFFSLQQGYEKVVFLFDKWGLGMVLLAGLTPIPYKLFTIAAGASSMPMLPFVVGSFIGRVSRFVIVAALVKKLGPSVEKKLLKNLDILGWWLVGILILGFCLLKLI